MAKQMGWWVETGKGRGGGKVGIHPVGWGSLRDVENTVQGGWGQHGVHEPDCFGEITIAQSGSLTSDAAELSPRWDGGEQSMGGVWVSATMLEALQMYCEVNVSGINLAFGGHVW